MVGSTAYKTYLEKDLVTTTINNGILFYFCLWLHSFYYSVRTLIPLKILYWVTGLVKYSSNPPLLAFCKTIYPPFLNGWGTHYVGPSSVATQIFLVAWMCFRDNHLHIYPAIELDVSVTGRKSPKNEVYFHITIFFGITFISGLN